MGIVTNEATAARGVAVLQDLPGDEDAPGRAWQGILPSRRATWVLSVVLFATMLVQGMVNPIAALIDGNYSWSNPIPFELSVVLLVALFAAQAAAQGSALQAEERAWRAAGGRCVQLRTYAGAQELRVLEAALPAEELASEMPVFEADRCCRAARLAVQARREGRGRWKARALLLEEKSGTGGPCYSKTGKRAERKREHSPARGAPLGRPAGQGGLRRRLRPRAPSPRRAPSLR